MMQYNFIVDLQGFKDYNNSFILKEFAIATKHYTQIFLIKPPFSYSYLSSDEQKQVRWIERNRGILWREGFIDIREFKRLIKPILNEQTVLVKGEEKIKWLKELCDSCEVIDIAEKGCPNLPSLYKMCDSESNKLINSSTMTCMFHKKICGLKNVLLIQKWITNIYK